MVAAARIGTLGVWLISLWALRGLLGSWEGGGEMRWGAQVSMVSSPALPRALIAELLLYFPISLHVFCISTPASYFTELMTNGRPVIRLISEPSQLLIVSS